MRVVDSVAMAISEVISKQQYQELLSQHFTMLCLDPHLELFAVIYDWATVDCEEKYSSEYRPATWQVQMSRFVLLSVVFYSVGTSFKEKLTFKTYRTPPADGAPVYCTIGQYNLPLVKQAEIKAHIEQLKPKALKYIFS